MLRSFKNTLRRESCPICGSSKIIHFKTYKYKEPIVFSTINIKLSEKPELWNCNTCSSKFVQNNLTEKESIKLYQSGDSGNRWSFSPLKEDKPKEILINLNDTIAKTKILDIGASTGSLLDYSKSLGCDTSGVEYSESARKILKDKGHKVFNSLVDVNEKFDVITAFDLVEHLYDFNSFIIKCHEVLNTGGLLIILTGDPNCKTSSILGAKWWYYHFPEHVVFPSLKYFESHIKYFYLVKAVSTFNSHLYMSTSWLKFLKKLLIILTREKGYYGIPSFWPDHKMYILKKQDK